MWGMLIWLIKWIHSRRFHWFGRMQRQRRAAIHIRSFYSTARCLLSCLCSVIYLLREDFLRKINKLYLLHVMGNEQKSRKINTRTDVDTDDNNYVNVPQMCPIRNKFICVWNERLHHHVWVALSSARYSHTHTRTSSERQPEPECLHVLSGLSSSYVSYFFFFIPPFFLFVRVNSIHMNPNQWLSSFLKTMSTDFVIFRRCESNFVKMDRDRERNGLEWTTNYF